MKIIRIVSLASLGLLALTAAHAQKSGPGKTAPAPQLQTWMSPEVADAWKQGYKGSGVTVTVVDDFRSNQGLYGNLGQGTQLLRHGEWTLKEASMIAPSATLRSQDFTSGTTVALNRGLNVLNLSYGMYAAAGFTPSQIGWSAQETSIISYAQNGKAVISKAAGNDAVAIGAANASGNVDYLNVSLKGAQSAIYVGALNTNGTTSAPASLASYSNTPGADATVQNQFLVVGVDGAKTGLYGTSFAAPIITGYSAILGSKFTKATATQITNQLLNTARQDTISNYNAATHGRGEASITRALAPISIQ
ncbi:S8 family serine peptidase [Limnohabitans sp. T6-20]|uniref:S8 family serine peptidase n=1 Tax=Limnohabitans sp. T6-20 TaxID=1100725 RepID=UPI000D3C042B|nr:S8 family serine peptidase [Limnohabitans sp. T6-20]PUE10177.1 peptidase S8 and S53 subtilisin kexin sedolisin [Limnohabitans sp. T6-20]